ncbi:hypothetical protein BSKO_05384 [Bryopsis sp. KO-2023]|nr:hypothetical protein BSKO_05384 [Bryopsis sp. KO-2023]
MAREARVPPLVDGPVPLKDLQDKARSGLVDIIDSMVGGKAMVFDVEITGPLGLIVPAAVLAEHGVEKMFHLGEGMEEPQSKNILYLARANVMNAQLIAKQIKSYNLQGHMHEYSVFFIPRLTCLCEKVFEEEGVKGDATLGEYPLEFIPFDDDVLSMEMERTYRESAVEGDHSALHSMARGLTNLQATLGSIPRIIGKGVAAEAVKNMCIKMRRERGANVPATGKIRRMVLIDRGVDLLTPMITQVTYEGIIDEVLGIKNNLLSVEVSEKAGAPESKKYILNSSDALHKEMRDIPWPHAAPRIREWVQKMRSDFQNIKEDPGSRSISEMHDFTNRLKQLGSTEKHSNISAPIGKMVPSEEFQARLQMERQIIEDGMLEEGCKYVEDLLFQGGEMMHILRIMCLLSLTNNGLPKKICDNLRRAFLLTFGYENLSMFQYLETAKLLNPRPDSKNIFPSIRRSFNLVYDVEGVTCGPGNAGEGAAKDIGYIYWGYSPLSVRLVELALKQPRPKPGMGDGPDAPGWRGRGAEVLNLLPGQHFDVMLGEDAEVEGVAGPLSRGGDESETVLVVFLGGVTFSEISALRFLTTVSNGKMKFLVATTRLLNGNSWLKSFQDPDVAELMKRAKGSLLS